MKKIFMFLNFTLGNEIEEISWRLQCQEYLLPLNKYTYDIINEIYKDREHAPKIQSQEELKY